MLPAESPVIKLKCVGSLAELECRVARQARPAVAKVLAGKSAIGVLGPVRGPHNMGLPSNKTALITSDRGKMRSMSTKWP